MKQNLTFIVLCKDAADAKEMGRALGSHGGASLLMLSDDAEQVFTETVRLRPTAVIISISNIGEPALNLVRRINIECPATAVICASRSPASFSVNMMAEVIGPPSVHPSISFSKDASLR